MYLLTKVVLAIMLGFVSSALLGLVAVPLFRHYKIGQNINNYVKSLKHLLTFKKRFDTVYPSHGSFPVEPDIIEKLIEGAESIIRGEVKGEDMDLYGNPITLYKFPFAGFYAERAQ